MSVKPKRILVTGSSGQIGSELIVELANKYGRDNVVASDRSSPSNDISRYYSSSFEKLDVLDRDAIQRIVKQHDIDTIYHLAGILSATGEKNHTLAWQVNTFGLQNVLEVAKDVNANVFWPSSIAVFGPDVPKEQTSQNSILSPLTIYGVTKASGELLCNYYHVRYGLDIRSIRLPGIISSEKLPGGGTTDFAVEIFYAAIQKGRYECFVNENTTLPMLYMPDGIRAILDLMDADISKINVRTSYNLGGLEFSAKELALEIKKHIPYFTVEYKPDFRQEIADSWPRSIDDSQARKDWGWMPKYDLASMTVDMIQKLSKKKLSGKKD